MPATATTTTTPSAMAIQAAGSGLRAGAWTLTAVNCSQGRLTYRCDLSIGAPPREEVQFGRGAQSYVLLILAHGRSYGYQIRQRLEDDFGYEKAAADPGALYRLLREMAAARFIESTWDIAETGPARRYYQLTDAGRDQLRLSAERLERQARRIGRFFEVYAQLEVKA